MTATGSHRRRIDKVLDPSYVAELTEASPDELRARIQVAREEEEDYSYYRRMLHARIDTLRELESGGGAGGVAEPASGPQRHRGARPRLVPKAMKSPGRRDVERLLSEPLLANLTELTSHDVEDALERLTDWEERVSATRKALHGVIEALEAELAKRYRDGLEPSLDRLQ